MNRQQRRAQERQKDKDLQKKIKQQISIMEKSNIQNETLEMAKWVQGLSNKDAECCNRLLREHTRAHIEDFSIAFQEVIENFLIEQGYENHEELMIQFTNDIEDTGIKLNEIENEGGNYYMSINKDKEKIIADYNNKIQEGLSEREAIEDIMTKYSKYSKSSIKNIIKTCKSNTCPMKKDNGECGNKVVTEEKQRCSNYEGNNVVTTTEKEVTTPEVTEKSKKRLCFEFFDKNKDLSKEEAAKKVAEKFGVKETSAETYHRVWRRDRGIVPATINKEFDEAIKDMIKESKTKQETKEEIKTESKIENNNQEEKKMGFKVLKKIIVLDLEGQCGKYHVEGNKVAKNDIIFTTIEHVDKYYKAEEEEITKRLIEIKKSKEELKQVIREYVEV